MINWLKRLICKYWGHDYGKGYCHKPFHISSLSSGVSYSYECRRCGYVSIDYDFYDRTCDWLNNKCDWR